MQNYKINHETQLKVLLVDSIGCLTEYIHKYDNTNTQILKYQVKVLLVHTIGCLTAHWTRLVFARTQRHRERHCDSGHIVKIGTGGSVNFYVQKYKNTAIVTFLHQCWEAAMMLLSRDILATFSSNGGAMERPKATSFTTDTTYFI